MIKEHEKDGLVCTPSNWFCFDNEAFRYLAIAIKNLHDESKLEMYSESWTIAHGETLKLFKKAIEMKPHVVANTISVIQARKVCFELAHPLARFAQAMDISVKNCIKLKKDIDHKGRLSKRLEKSLHTMVLTMERKDIDHPKTVCFTCAKDVDIEGSTTQQKDYVQVCHERCGLGNVVPSGHVGHSELARCRAFKNTLWLPQTTCFYCRHSWQEHLHLRYDAKIVPMQRTNRKISTQLDEAVNEKEKLSKTIEFCTKEQREIEEEITMVEKAQVKFAVFLNKQSLLPINDGFEPYMEILIKNEEDKMERDEELIDHYKTRLANFRKEKDKIIQSDGTAGIPTVEEIFQEKEKLIKMPKYGDDVCIYIENNDATLHPFQIKQKEDGMRYKVPHKEKGLYWIRGKAKEILQTFRTKTMCRAIAAPPAAPPEMAIKRRLGQHIQQRRKLNEVQPIQQCERRMQQGDFENHPPDRSNQSGSSRSNRSDRSDQQSININTSMYDLLPSMRTMAAVTFVAVATAVALILCLDFLDFLNFHFQ